MNLHSSASSGFLFRTGAGSSGSCKTLTDLRKLFYMKPLQWFPLGNLPLPRIA